MESREGSAGLVVELRPGSDESKTVGISFMESQDVARAQSLLASGTRGQGGTGTPGVPIRFEIADDDDTEGHLYLAPREVVATAVIGSGASEVRTPVRLRFTTVEEAANYRQSILSRAAAVARLVLEGSATPAETGPQAARLGFSPHH